MKSILIVTDAWYPQVNGPVRTMQKVADVLVARGYDVQFLHPGEFRTVPAPTYNEIRLALTTANAVGKRIEALRPDGIHIATEGPLGWAARNYCARHRIPFSTSYHTQFPEYLRARAPIPIPVTYAVLRKFHSASKWVLTTTETVDKELRERGFKNTVVWRRGVDTKNLSPDRRVESGAKIPWPRPIFMYLGRVAVEKNVEAFLKLDLPGTKLVVGEGPLRENLQARYPKAVFTGRATEEDLGTYFASADVFVFPSRTDTFGLVLLEALASGTPVAGYPVRGPVDVIGDAPVGVLDEDLRAAALKALSIPRADCRAFAEQFTWENSADEFLAHLPEIAR